MKFAIVHWTDAVIHGNEVYHAPSENFQPASGMSCGWLVKKDKKGITLAMDFFGDGEVRTVETIYAKQINAFIIFDFVNEETK